MADICLGPFFLGMRDRSLDDFTSRVIGSSKHFLNHNTLRPTTFLVTFWGILRLREISLDQHPELLSL